MMRALILNGKVVDKSNQPFEAHDSLTWVDAPDDVEIGWSYLNNEFSAPQQDQITYDVLRRMEYPPVTDYIDGVVKGDQAQIQAYIDACLAVKAKYPKPQEP
jgi:hypothetical protein